jgi:hypothetical protein
LLVGLVSVEPDVDVSGKIAVKEVLAWMLIISISDVNTCSFRSLALWEVGKEKIQPLSFPSEKNI